MLSKSSKGFALIEMLTTVLIIGILLGVGLPVFQYFLVKQHANAARDNLIRAIQLAQHEAFVRRIPVVICPNKKNHQCSDEWVNGWMVFFDPLANAQLKNEDDLILINQSFIDGKIHWRAFPHSQNYLIFYPKNSSNYENGTFWYCRSSSINPLWSIVMNKTGRLRLQIPDKNGNLYDSQGKLLLCV